jgi:hypothetical protein
LPFALYALIAASVAFAETREAPVAADAEIPVTETEDPTKSDLFTADNILLGVFLLGVSVAGDYFLVRSFLNKKN